MCTVKISIQTQKTVSELGFEKAYKLYKDAGFQALDWNINDLLPGDKIYAGTYRGSSVLEKSLDEILDYLEPDLNEIRKNGLKITQAHAPFPAMSLKYEDSLDFMIEIYKNCIRLCDHVGCKHLVIHAIHHQRYDLDHTPEEIDTFNWKLYTSLIPVLKETDVIVCIENIFSWAMGPKAMPRLLADHFGNPDFAVDYIDRLNREAGKECFGMCLDTGHLNLCRIDERIYIPKLGKRIKCLHVHDNDSIEDRHEAPYSGNIYWDGYLKALREAGYEGDISFETGPQTTLNFGITEDILLSQLKAIADIGCYFRKVLSE